MSADELRVDVEACAYGFRSDRDGLPVGLTPVPLNTVWSYEASDPYALTVTIFCGGSVKTWSLSRESVTEAVSTLAHRVGQGDTRLTTFAFVWGDLTILTLQSPSGTLDLTFVTHDLVEFLAGTEQIVAPGTEAARVEESLEHELLGFQP
jgi:hypothetical protein